MRPIVRRWIGKWLPKHAHLASKSSKSNLWPCRSTVYALIKAGELKASRIGCRTLVLRADLEELVTKYRVDDWSKLQAELKTKRAVATDAA
jgi:excisionase family DNA binding protein